MSLFTLFQNLFSLKGNVYEVWLFSLHFPGRVACALLCLPKAQHELQTISVILFSTTDFLGFLAHL